MKQLMIVLLLTVASCGRGEVPCNSGWFDAAGLRICDNDLGVSSDEIELAIDILEEDLTSRTRYTNIVDLRGTFKDNDIEVIFTDKDIGVNCERVDEWGDVYYCERAVSGVNLDHVRNYVIFDECLGRTSFIHELLHSIEYFYLDIEDGSEHDTPEFYILLKDTPEVRANTVESSTNRKIRNRLERCEPYRGYL
jgi:hypothetical protein